MVRNPYFLYFHLSSSSFAVQTPLLLVVHRYCGKCASCGRERGAIVCVLHTGSLTRIYIGVYQRIRTGRHCDKTCVCVNPFVPRFRCRRRRRRLSRSRRVGSFSALHSREELRFLFASLPFSLDPSRDLPARSFRFPECKRDARVATEFESRYPPSH